MPGGRKPKVDGAYQDLTLKPIPGSDEFGGYTQQEEQIAAVGTPPSDMLIPQDAAAMQYKPEDIFAKGTERQDEAGTFDSTPQDVVSLPVGTDIQILVELIKEKAPVTIQRF
jgi:hypothetical protein